MTHDGQPVQTGLPIEEYHAVKSDSQSTICTSHIKMLLTLRRVDVALPYPLSANYERPL